MPRGEPTKVVRLPVWLLDHLEASRPEGTTMAEHITRRLAPRAPVIGGHGNPHAGPQVVMVGAGGVGGGGTSAGRCSCATPTLSKVVTNLCTTCHCLR